MRRGWRGPEYEGELPSLGWALIDRWAESFPSPRDEKQPFVLTDEQALTIVAWFTIHPVTGQFVYRRGCSRRSKGSGKSPLEAAKCISELGLDVRFDGWDADGEPVGRPWGTMGDPAPWVQIASLSEDQDENTYTPLYYFLTARDGALADELGIDAGLTRCFLRSRTDAKIEPATSRAGSREGQPVTYATLDETGLMTVQNGGVKLARTVRRNVAKMGGRSYDTTNGFVPGEGSVAEGTHKAFEKGNAGIFYDAVEAPSHIDGVEVTEEASDDVLRDALRLAYGDAWWVDIDRLVADIRDDDMPWEDAERWFFNWNRKGQGKAIDPKRWDELPEVRVIPDGTRIGVGFDGSISEDATALVACTADGHLFVPTHMVGGDELPTIWERPANAPKGWKIPRLEVERAVDALFGRFDVGRWFGDPPKWQTEQEKWAETYGDEVVLFLDTNQPRRMSAACDRFTTALGKKGEVERTLTHDGSSLLRSHVLAMVLKKAYVKNEDPHDGRTRWVFTKGDSRKIDAGIAAVLALEAAMTMPELQAASSAPWAAYG